MRDILQLFFSFLFILYGYGQKKTVSIHWANSYDLEIVDSEINIEGAASFFVDESGFADQLITSWEKRGEVYEGSKASNVVLEPLSLSLLRDIDKEKLPKSFKVSVVSNKAREKFLEVLSFNPLVYDKGVVKRIVSFNLQSKVLKKRGFRNFLPPGRSSSVLATGVWESRKY